jgi:hypothetical protein
VGRRKVEGLRDEILRLAPYTRVETRAVRLESLLEMELEWVLGHDLVVSALGEPTIELEFNLKLQAAPGAPPAVFAWVEPLGLGGHVVLAHRLAGRGCLECLYGRPYAGGPVENRAAFAEQGVTYARDVLGCGSFHVPFGDLDAQQTAGLCVRMALAALTQAAMPALQSWKGDRTAFVAAGYHVTPRYEAPDAERAVPAAIYVRGDCPACGS